MLVRAVERNSLDQVRLMVKSGVDPGMRGESGATPLHVAAWRGNVEMVRLLLEFHAPVNIRDTTYGSSPLAWAHYGLKTARAHGRNADEDYRAIIRALMDAGAVDVPG